MKRFVLALPLALFLVACKFWLPTSAPNPDPNHTHADFAVWVNGQMLNFSDARYMSGSSKDEPAGEHDDAHHKHASLHLHDGNGHVIHRHKPGLGIGEFFASLDITMTKDCLTLDDFQYGKLDAGWKADFAITKNLCNNGKFHWTMVVNGTEKPMDPHYVFADDDKILLTYSAGDSWEEEWKQMTDDACLFSQTCPRRGKPPAENCIADPAVPCTE